MKTIRFFITIAWLLILIVCADTFPAWSGMKGPSRTAGFRGGHFTEPVTGMKFAFIPRGCFKMGCHGRAGKCKKDEQPAHTVCVDGFWMGIYEVSQQQWQNVMAQNPSRFSGRLNHPVENVSFEDVQRFIRSLNSRIRATVSLPTEAQWEYACRNGGKKMAFPWGNDGYRPEENCGTCNSGSFHGETAPVGSFFANELGLYDMAGNVKEWCRDVYDKKAYGRHTLNNPAHQAKGILRVVRGGAFTDQTANLRCTVRGKFLPGIRSDNLGFRLVLNRGH